MVTVLIISVVIQEGFEPPTHGLEGRCSILLSYWTKNLERAMGIEPTTSAWKAEVLPLNYTRSLLVGVAGFEPATPCSQGRCATKLRYTPNTKNILP